jgi:YihY family inner membrane protein
VSARPTGFRAIARAVVREVRLRDVTTLAASIAYYAFVSVLPLFVLAAVVATALGGPALRRAVVDLAGRYLLPVGQELVADALANTAGQSGVTIVGLGLLVWSSLKLFRGIDTAVARIYDTTPRGFLRSVRAGVTVLVAVGIGAFGGVALVGIVAVLDLPGISALAPVVFFLVLVAALFPVYYLTPAVDVSIREALPGTLVGACCWTLLGTAFAFYTAITAASSQFALYGVLGAVLLLVTWFYLAGLALLVGVTLNAVLADRTTARNRQVQHPRDRDHVTTAMTGDDTRGGDADPSPAPDIEELADRVEAVRADLDAFESDVEDRTVDRPELEADLKAYVRRRMRRGHARGWGPYLVLLYGTIMTLGAFYFLSDLLAIVAMIVIFLSTLGLYALFVLVGAGLSLLGTPGRALDAVRRFRR